MKVKAITKADAARDASGKEAAKMKVLAKSHLSATIVGFCLQDNGDSTITVFGQTASGAGEPVPPSVDISSMATIAVSSDTPSVLTVDTPEGMTFGYHVAAAGKKKTDDHAVPHRRGARGISPESPVNPQGEHGGSPTSTSSAERVGDPPSTVVEDTAIVTIVVMFHDGKSGTYTISWPFSVVDGVAQPDEPSVCSP
jgi:hypothetical protein